MANKKIQYFVEGKCEEQLINSLKKAPNLVKTGKCRVFNVITDKLTRNDCVGIEIGSILVFVFDTDVAQTNILDENINTVKTYVPKVNIVLIPQVKNIEDELLSSTNIKSVVDLTRSASLSDFKRDFIALKDCRNVLENHSFNIKRIWIKNPQGIFAKYPQDSAKIK